MAAHCRLLVRGSSAATTSCTAFSTRRAAVTPWSQRSCAHVLSGSACVSTQATSQPFCRQRLRPGAVPLVGTMLPQRRRFAARGQFEKQLMPEDILHLRAQSMTIMQDPVCEIRPEEAKRYVVEHTDPITQLPMWHPRRISVQVTQPFRQRKLVVSRFTDLIIERIDNDPLCRAFMIDSGFNMQVYFMILHAWLLHQRLVLEGPTAKRLDEDLFESCWTLVRNWLWLKKTPEYRFDAELQNVQEYMLGCCIALDKALERSDILPARLQQTLWANVYSGSAKKDASALIRLTRYCLRQLGLMLQLDTECFLSGSFVWADFPLPDDLKPAPRQLPVWREEFGKVVRERIDLGR